MNKLIIIILLFISNVVFTQAGAKDFAEMCENDEDCKSGFCLSVGRRYHKECFPKHKNIDNGETCKENYDCVSLNCVNSKCEQGKTKDFARCTDSRQCSSAYCYYVAKICGSKNVSGFYDE